MDHERFASSSGGRKAHRIESGYYVQGKTIYYTGSAVENSCYILKQGPQIKPDLTRLSIDAE